MTERRKWSKIKAGDRIELGGRDWTVEKIKPKGKRLRVSVRSGAHRAESKVDPSEKVHLAGDKEKPRQSQARAGSNKPQPTRPPRPADGDPWETQQDRMERKLDEILQARLIGEATDEDAGYYVPPVDVSTIASHLAIFHGADPSEHGGEGEMLDAHTAEHLRAEAGKATLAINHWHTKKRPTKGKK